MRASGRPASGSKSRNFQETPLSLEQLESRMLCTVNNLLDSLELLGASSATKSTTVKAAVNSAPTFVGSVTVAGGTTVKGKEANLTAIAKDDAAESNLVYAWKVATAPAGGSVTFATNNSNAAKVTKATFSKAGVYNLAVTATDKGGLKTTINQRVTITLTQSTLQVVGKSGTVAPDATLGSVSKSEQFTVSVLDQWGKAVTTTPAIAWSQVSAPSGGAATISTVRGVTTVTFNKVGTYKFRVTSGSLGQTFSINVTSALSKIEVSPGTTEVQAGATQQFVARAYDQFNAAMNVTPTWTTTAGAINSSGLLTAPGAAGSVTVTAVSGTVRGTATVTVKPSTGMQTSSLSTLVSTLYADGSINRADMIQLLRSTGGDGVVDASELTDLRYLITNATTFKIPEYVKVLANNVVNGNTANAMYQGAAAGNLTAGSAATLLTKLVDKWFMGTDLPTVSGSGISYRTATGSLFVGTPSRADEKQGQLGDCYFIATIGAIADRNPTAVSNMFVDNGDGTFTVRFYTGTYSMFYASDGTVSDGFASGVGIADYVTVNRQLPSYSNGTFAYSNYGRSVTDTSVPLWIALAEKAYAQWNETGKEGRNGTNTYSGIEGGWMGRVNAQVLGANATAYYMSSATEQTLINVLAANKAVTIGTKAGATQLVGSHAYSVTGYDSATQKFTLYNPWGFMQPAPLTWAQLQSNCSMFSVANATSTPIAVTVSNLASPTVRAGYSAEEATLYVMQDSTNHIAAFGSDSETADEPSERAALQVLIALDSDAADDQQANVLAATDLAFGDDQDPLATEIRRLSPELVDSVLDEIDSLLAEMV